ncbi:hypothetical protein BC830DRAFT_1174960 [Chytriomyces sp. MP71]|nr:hypothetical protein BC830DRAFT_1174960 [Chytriomyces sp. MP71]
MTQTESKPLINHRNTLSYLRVNKTLALKIMILFNRPSRIFISGLAIALSVLAMHHLGINSIRMEATYTFNPMIVFISVVVAMAAATAGMFIIFRVLPYYPYDAVKIVAAALIAIAVNGMHYTGLGALTYYYTPQETFEDSELIDGTTLAESILYLEIVLSIASEVVVSNFQSHYIHRLRARMRGCVQTGTSVTSSRPRVQ